MEHTKGKWEVGASGRSVIVNGVKIIARMCINGSTLSDSFSENEPEANAQRIVDCVNACDGMDNPIEEIAKLKAEIERLRPIEKIIQNTIEREKKRKELSAEFVELINHQNLKFKD